MRILGAKGYLIFLVQSHGGTHLQGRAELWYQAGGENLKHKTCNEFTEVLQARFSDEIFENIMGESNKLGKVISVLDCQNKCKEPQPLVLLKNPGLHESYFIDRFITGLREEVKNTV